MSYTNNLQRYPHMRFLRHNNCIADQDGYTTIFASMLFLVMAGLMLLCLDVGLVYQGESRGNVVQTGLSEHLLANYNVPLAEKYELYFLDPALSESELKARALIYLDEVFGTGTEGFVKTGFWPIQIEEIQAEPYGTLQEQDCRYFTDQIKEYMKADAAKERIQELLEDAARETENQQIQIDDNAQLLDETKESAQEHNEESTDNTLKPSESVPEDSVSDYVHGSSLMKRAKDILQYGILGIVTDSDSLSERKVSSSLLPFKNLKENGIRISIDTLQNLDTMKELWSEHDFSGLMEQIEEKGLISLYIGKYFDYYGKKQIQDGHLLMYEAEYILGGAESDRENLEYTVNRMVLLRFALNSVYAYKDADLGAQAFRAASVLAGATGNPELIEVIRYTLLTILNFLESVKDVELLLEGQKVPLFKSTESWRTTVGGTENSNSGKNTNGMTYPEYLQLLLLLQTDVSSQCLRMQNLMHGNIVQVQPEFDIRKCYAGVRIESKIRICPRFYLGDQVLENNKIYTY